MKQSDWWMEVAWQVVNQVQRELPDALQKVAQACPVRLVDQAQGSQSDLLGLFEGMSLLDASPGVSGEDPRITLFVQALREEAEDQIDRFMEEVRITYLHELGHYLGWDEGDLDQGGLS